MPESLLTLEHALQRGGDDLYRSALLLAPNAQSAATVLVAAARCLSAAPPSVPDEQVLLGALLHALPPERQRRLRAPLPEWARDIPADRAATTAALARLPRQQRLVLGLATLRGWDAEQIAQAIERDVAAVQALTRDALLTLAPQAAPDLDLHALRGDDAPEDCKATRAALGMNDAALRYDPAVRGHLALCADCRAAEQGWQQLAAAAEDTLRRALRPKRMPGALTEEVQAALAPSSDVQHTGLRRHWRRGLLPLSILALIGVLVFPRARPPAPEATSLAVAPATPRELVQRATDTLYQPPGGTQAQQSDTVWNGRWQMRWNFGDGSFATLNGDLWNDPANKRHRVQLVHEAGGGPFEFELADGKQQVNYAVTENYGRSLYPLLFNKNNARLVLHTPADSQPAMLQARLNSGAWGLAGAYLRQAQQAADLRSWGRQTAADGTPLEVVGFSGTSPLGLPPDAPDRVANAATILLTIDLADGTLREVRELAGAASGEQIGQTTWRFVGGGTLETKLPQVSTAFNLQQAWNGVGSFQNTLGSFSDPALPFITSDAVRPLSSALLNTWGWSWMPPTPPAGTTSAMLFESSLPSSYPGGGIAAYIGPDRLLVIRGVWIDVQNGPAVRDLLGDTFERIEQNGKTIRLRPGATQHYDVLVSSSPRPLLQGEQAIQISAQGFTRAELLQIIGTLAPLDLAGFRAQFKLFANPQHSDPAVLEALLNALAPPEPLPPDTARHVTTRVFQRHGAQVDSLSDPYHRPPGSGVPEQFTTETWLRANSAGKLTEVVNQSRVGAGPVFQSTYNGTNRSWLYDATANSAQQWQNNQEFLPGAVALTLGQTIALRMLDCGGAQLTTLADGGHAVMTREAHWYTQSCMHPDYPGLINNQVPDVTRNIAPFDGGPYLLDLSMSEISPLTIGLYLDDTGRPTQVNVSAGDARSGTLVESWRLASDEQVPSARVPPDVFSATPPPALISEDYTLPQTQPPTDLVHTATLTEAAQLTQTSLWQLPTNDKIQFVRSEANPQGGTVQPFGSDIFDSAVQHGFAARLTYQMQSADGVKTVQICEGATDRFGAFLRSQARWVSSQPVTLRAAGRDVSGWLVITPNNTPWTLFELDGTLIAVDKATEVVNDGMLEGLEPVGR